MIHAMIDLETLSTNPNATILTVGGVKFDPHTQMKPYGDLYFRVDVDSQTKLGRDVQQETLDWWATQPKEIMEEALAMDYTEENYVKNLTGLISRLQDEKGGFKLGGANIKNNRKNVAWQTKQQILKMIEDHEVAVEAQDVADTNRITSWEFDQIKNRVDELGNFEL